jgi:hypothetical protein
MNFEICSGLINEKGYYFKTERSKFKGKTTVVVDYEIGKFF